MSNAKVIAEQFGNQSFYMIGAKHLTAIDENTLQFSFMRNGSKSTICQIQYNEGLDLYSMKFFTRTMNLEKEYDEVYCDSMHEIFSRHTGLALQMPRFARS